MASADSHGVAVVVAGISVVLAEPQSMFSVVVVVAVVVAAIATATMVHKRRRMAKNFMLLTLNRN